MSKQAITSVLMSPPIYNQIRLNIFKTPNVTIRLQLEYKALSLVFSHILIKNALFNPSKFDYTHSIVANKRIVGGAKVRQVQ